MIEHLRRNGDIPPHNMPVFKKISRMFATRPVFPEFPVKLG
jgi:hypothetical protein